MAKIVKLSPVNEQILELLKTEKREMTFAEIKAIIPEANPSQLSALVRHNFAVNDKKMVTETIVRTAEKTVYSAKWDERP